MLRSLARLFSPRHFLWLPSPFLCSVPRPEVALRLSPPVILSLLLLRLSRSLACFLDATAPDCAASRTIAGCRREQQAADVIMASVSEPNDLATTWAERAAESNATVFLVVVCVVWALAFGTALVRFYTRAVIVRSLGKDDVFMVLAVVSGIVSYVCLGLRVLDALGTGDRGNSH